MKSDLLAALSSRPLLCDGAMGTQLFAAGLGSGDCGMLWNVERADVVRGVHAAYRNAGCDLITSNTFGGTTFELGKHGFADRAAELNPAGVRLAREAAGATGFVLGDVGPFGDFLEPLGDTTEEELDTMFRAQISALAKSGADAILIETMSDPAEMEVAIAAAKAAASLPIVATYAFENRDIFRTMMGTSVEEAIQRAIAAGAHIVGANCGVELSFEEYIALARELVHVAGDVPVILQPNAGSPVIVNGATVYNATPEEMAQVVQSLLDTGVRIIGGCCGTSPAHLAAMRAKL